MTFKTYLLKLKKKKRMMLKIIASKDLIDHVIQAIHITDEKIEPQRRPVFLEGILRLITVMMACWEDQPDFGKRQCRPSQASMWGCSY